MRPWAWISAGLFLLCFAVLGLNANPSISWDDAGEFTTVGHFLAVLHPPGYPLTVLGIKLFQGLLPVPLSFAANLFSVFMASAAVVLCATWGGQLAKLSGAAGPVARCLGVLAGLALLSHRHFFYLAMTVETYHLNVALIVLALMLWCGNPKNPSLRNALWMGLLLAQASLVHYTGLLFGLVWTLWMLAQPGRWRILGGMVWLGLLTVSLAMLTPLRAAADVPFKWFGGVHGPMELLGYLAGSDLGRTFTVKEQGQFLMNYGLNLFQHSPPLAHLLPWLLLPWLWWRWRQKPDQATPRLLLARGLVVMGLLSGVVLQLLLMFEFRPIKIMSINLFYLPHHALLSGALAFGLGALPFVHRLFRGVTGWGLMGLLTVGALVWGIGPNRNSEDRMAELMVEDILRTADHDSRVFMDYSLIGFPMVYGLLAQNGRRDVMFMDRRDNFGRADYAIRDIPPSAQLKRIFETEKKLIGSNPPKVNYFMTEESMQYKGLGWLVVPRGLLMEVVNVGTRPQWEDMFPYYRFPGPRRPGAAPPYVERSGMGHFVVLQALQAQAREEKDRAHALWRKAIRVAPDDQRVLTVAGRFLSLLGHAKEARTSLETALKVNPRLLGGGGEMVRLLISQNRLGEAEKVLAKQKNPSAALRLATAYDKKNRLEKAEGYYRMAYDGGVRPWLVVDRLGVMAYENGRYQEAMTFFAEAARRHPKPDDMWLNHALAAIRAKDYAAAESALLGLRKRHPDDVEVIWNLAVIYSRPVPRPREAYELWNEVLRLDPDHPRRADVEKLREQQKALAGIR